MMRYLKPCAYNEPQLYEDGVVFVPLSTFPTTLKKTYFYKNIYKNYKKNDPTIPIPVDIYKREMNLSLLIDMLDTLMEIIELLPDKKMPYSNYDFIINNRVSIIPHFSKLRENYKTFEFVDEIEILINTPESKVLEKLIIENRKHLLIYCLKKNIFNVTPQRVFDVASEYYKLDILEYIYKYYNKQFKFYSESESDSDDMTNL